ncbi:hypothetical protein AAC691_01825 [Nguyenibacter vanlangensis]|uniref:Uncharacterized protein n=1 Tax=Nguyenibacter vanlangensis TaxID=1216886 RepID=A0ABZ3D666_9PROT
MMNRCRPSRTSIRPSGRGLACFLGLAGCVMAAGCQASRPAPAIQPMSELPLPLQAYLSIDTYFIAQGMVSGRLADGGLMRDQARGLVADTLYARHLAAENMLHPSADGQHHVRQAIESMLACIGQTDSGSKAACLPPVSAPDGRPAEAASPPAEAAAAPR